MIHQRWVWPIIIVVSAIAVSIVVFGNVQSPIRPVIAFWFMLVCPGMAFVRLIGIREFFAEMSIAVALSVALDTLVAGVMLYTGSWSPNFGLAVLIGLSLTGVVLQLIMTLNQLSKEAAVRKVSSLKNDGGLILAFAAALLPTALGTAIASNSAPTATQWSAAQIAPQSVHLPAHFQALTGSGEPMDDALRALNLRGNV